MFVPRKKSLFRKDNNSSRPYRIVVLLVLIILVLFMLQGISQGSVTPLLIATPTPTRTVDSYVQEGETHFIAGDLDKSLEAFQRASEVNPNDIILWIELARIQVYSSSLITTDEAKYARLSEALESINRAVEINTEDSTAHAVRAFVLDWLANPGLVGEDWQALLTEAEQEAVIALQLDNQNTLALAYYAEILVDQQKWIQADQYIREAVQRDPSTMDVHRINAYVQESLGNYSEAITEYKRAAEINPNLTFLYLAIGANYRKLKQYDLALAYFDRAANINEQLNIKDPIPYLSIAKTYVQMGQFLTAGLNARKGLQYSPDNPDVYGQLGIIYFKARNYEGAIPALKCALRGCNAEESCEVRQCNPEEDPMVPIDGLPLTANTVVYYFTYGSVLAGMHRETNGYCEEAMQILRLVKQGFPDDETIMQIVEESENICRSYGYY
ncbi:MAG TPA: tetratricopeptide repeat protein [Anaerolineae bacterium]|nr:tetratricopeptide repeat protein [Anaerolineae bacterium]